MMFWHKPDHRLRLLEVMQRERVFLPERLSAQAARDLEAAKQRCLGCNAKKLCDESTARLALFCPNTHYFQQLRTASLTFD